jgi:hypothetical protein
MKRYSLRQRKSAREIEELKEINRKIDAIKEQLTRIEAKIDLILEKLGIYT